MAEQGAADRHDPHRVKQRELGGRHACDRFAALVATERAAPDFECLALPPDSNISLGDNEQVAPHLAHAGVQVDLGDDLVVDVLFVLLESEDVHAPERESFGRFGDTGDNVVAVGRLVGECHLVPGFRRGDVAVPHENAALAAIAGRRVGAGGDVVGVQAFRAGAVDPVFERGDQGPVGGAHRLVHLAGGDVGGVDDVRAEGFVEHDGAGGNVHFRLCSTARA